MIPFHATFRPLTALADLFCGGCGLALVVCCCNDRQREFQVSALVLSRPKPMPIPHPLRDFWSAYAVAEGGDAGADESRFLEAFAFGDSPELAQSLGELVLKGIKRATAGSLWAHQTNDTLVPRPGDLSIVTLWDGTPLCVIQTEAVQIVPFALVTAEFAATEGEGDGSLAFWQKVHREFFTRECARLGRDFTEDMPVVCERFRVVFHPAADSPKREALIQCRFNLAIKPAGCAQSVTNIAMQ